MPALSAARKTVWSVLIALLMFSVLSGIGLCVPACVEKGAVQAKSEVKAKADVDVMPQAQSAPTSQAASAEVGNEGTAVVGNFDAKTQQEGIANVYYAGGAGALVAMVLCVLLYLRFTVKRDEISQKQDQVAEEQQTKRMEIVSNNVCRADKGTRHG